jgi:hypothetical protein
MEGREIMWVVMEQETCFDCHADMPVAYFVSEDDAREYAKDSNCYVEEVVVYKSVSAAIAALGKAPPAQKPVDLSNLWVRALYVAMYGDGSKIFDPDLFYNLAKGVDK